MADEQPWMIGVPKELADQGDTMVNDLLDQIDHFDPTEVHRQLYEAAKASTFDCDWSGLRLGVVRFTFPITFIVPITRPRSDA